MNFTKSNVGSSPSWVARWWRRIAWAGAITVATAFGMHTHVLLAAAPHTFSLATAADLPVADAIVVPGARIHADGQPFHLLADRLAAARELYRLGKAKVIVLSGRGGGGLGADEVRAMRRWLLERGVPPAALVDDPLGLRTLDSMQRCRSVHGLRSVIVVTNPFHTARSVFLARSVGLVACGVEAPYLREYSIGTMGTNVGREVLARVWAWLDVFVFGSVDR